MNESTRTMWWRNFRGSHTRLQQFGQAADLRFHNGTTACGPTVLQNLALGWLGRFYTLDEIAVMVGYPADSAQRAGDKGMTTTQIDTFIRKSGLPYRRYPKYQADPDLTPGQLMRIENTMGPVAYAYLYGYNPEMYGFVYAGMRADGQPNGYAKRNGKTQLKGFENGSHIAIGMGYTVLRRSDGSVINRDHYWFDPNHGSPLRPERPPFDVINDYQFSRVVPSLRRIGRRPFQLLPTRVFDRPMEAATEW